MRVLLLNQCFHPDHVATAQHLTDLARALQAAGHEGTEMAASRDSLRQDLVDERRSEFFTAYMVKARQRMKIVACT